MRLASIREGTVLALDQLRANKSRSALTILGIVIGVAVVMAMSAMISGIRKSIFDLIMQGGAQNFLVMRFDPNAPRDPNRHGPPWGRNPPVTPAEVNRVSQLSTVKAAIAEVNANGEMAWGA
ncbi:MAG TPA: ABC transporter permease, partial [Longimicrobiales bacterium]